MVEIVLLSNLVLVLVLVWHVRGESQRQAALVKEAFAYIKAGGLEEKIRGDALDVNLKQLAQVAPPTVVKTPDEPDPEDIQPASMGETLMRKGRVVDGEGTVWGLG